MSNHWMNNSLIKIMLLSISLFTTHSVYCSPSLEGIRVYKHVLPLSTAHKQKIANDIDRYRNADNLWDVLRDEFSLAHYEDNPAVQEKIAWYMNNQDFLLDSATRAAPFLYYILQQVRLRHLPAEIVLVPIVESGYNPYAISNVGATGIWQMMPDTANGLGIKQNAWYDGRRDIIASTRAALNYLTYLQSFFEGNWLLALAAYNTGEGNVLAAIKRNIKLRKKTDFWSLPVSQQTRDYVPRLLALAAILSNPDQYPVYFPPVRNAPYLAQLDVGSPINFKYAALLAGLSYKKLMLLNPGFNRISTSRKGPHKLVVPIENVAQLSDNFRQSVLKPSLDWVHYQVGRGETILTIAEKFKIDPTHLSKINHFSQTNLRAGEILLIPAKITQPMSITTLLAKKTNKPAAKQFVLSPEEIKKDFSTPTQHIANYMLQPGDTIYMVRAGDTITNIAKRFYIAPQKLLASNRLSNERLQINQQLIIPTHRRSQLARNKIGDLVSKMYVVHRGDTLEKIAHKFKTTAAAIRVANLIEDNSLQEGERLIVPIQLQG